MIRRGHFDILLRAYSIQDLGCMVIAHGCSDTQ